LTRKKDLSIYPLLESEQLQKKRDTLFIDKKLHIQTRQKSEVQQKLDHIRTLKIPESRLEWSLQARPTIDGRKNIVQYMPMLQRLHEDNWGWIMIKFARQMTKSAYLATSIGHLMTTKTKSKSYILYF